MASPFAYAWCVSSFFLLVLTVVVHSVAEVCEDLLEDCGVRVSQGMCTGTSQEAKISADYCRRSCGFCTAVAMSDDAQDKSRHTARMRAAKPILEFFEWKHDDVVEVFYSEFLLSAWIVNHSPWNAYHSGLGFINTRTGRKMLLDFTPDDTSSVMKLVAPQVRLKSSLWRAVLLGEVEFAWYDGAHMAFYHQWPESFTTHTRVGQHSGEALFHLIDWVIDNYMPRYTAFNPVELVMPGAQQAGGNATVLRSRMCHDFVTDALWVLYDRGAVFEPEKLVFRDHIIMYGEIVESITNISSSVDARKRELRYMRGLDIYLEKIKDEFTHARTALLSLWRLRVPIFIHDEQGGYHRVKLLPPGLNYCYLPLAIPPEVYDPFGDAKLCALGMQANFTNFTAPWPRGALLAAEERIDQPESLIAILLAAICVAFTTRPAATSS
eukprot:TRINITY_DN46500_c0_g1_i1.p1 TRINITY_DN46500_c0_g1~~TRINITY_DN46500_c0_g1_i1.p1  ORF type:complete len:437 (-),score=47.71 TRINITY_DN46500_c0_g1_i1:110-1420(-)